jgi:putative Mg2+ transporter-C (MgtC) family protein
MVEYFSPMEALSSTEIAIRVGAALVCGALVGLERERKHRPAGFRTMILISLGSCGFVLIGHETIAHLASVADQSGAIPPGMPAPGQAEISRVLQGLIGGIGFLGAGAVIQNKRAVRGITTAAAVWVVAALGAACGLGLYALVTILGIATLFTLVVLDVVENRYFPEPDDFNTKGNGKKNGTDRAPSNGETDEVGDAGIGPARLRGEAPWNDPDPPAAHPPSRPRTERPEHVTR